MNLRFFADHCISNLIIETLQSWDNEILRLRDYIQVDALDHEVILKAQKLDAILVTLNGDFADIITYPPEVIPQMLSLLKNYISEHGNMADFRGKLLLVESYRIRIRQ